MNREYELKLLGKIERLMKALEKCKEQRTRYLDISGCTAEVILKVTIADNEELEKILGKGE